MALSMDWNHLGGGQLAKLLSDHAIPVKYTMPLSDLRVDMNPYIGRRLKLSFNGDIHCVNCQRKTRKSFNQGYCYPCFTKLPQCDSCIMSPEKCHYDAGTCRDPEWGETHCMVDHIVYLANASGLKVGITRATQIPTRWIDQGALQALPIFRVATRQQSGLVEDLMRSQVADKTNWRALIKGSVEVVDLESARDALFDALWSGIESLQKEYGEDEITPLYDEEVYEFDYPVDQYLPKAITQSFDKKPVVEGVLQGIRGQYLLLDTGAINIRKHGAYHIDMYVDETPA